MLLLKPDSFSKEHIFCLYGKEMATPGKESFLFRASVLRLCGIVPFAFNGEFTTKVQDSKG